MKKLFYIAALSLSVIFTGCFSDRGERHPHNIYMPDMAYSRAYETYAYRDSALFTENPTERGQKIFYNSQPVVGTISRGEEMPFPYAKDPMGDTSQANYKASVNAKNPIDSLTETQLVEAERLYLINCGICHGKNLDGNGPLYKDGKGPFAAKPATLVGDAKYEAMPDGQMFYSVAYGKGQMGSYASQLTRKQRWEVIYYIKNKQKAAKAALAPAATPDATTAKKS